jgi:RNA polymerase sigma factor (TIGR02999 family)
MAEDPRKDETYFELRRLARSYFDREGKEHTLQPTALVHEAYLRLGERDDRFNDREHFLASAARAMRHVLIDHARARKAEKRGGQGARVDLSTLHLLDSPSDDLLEVDEALELLMEKDEQLGQIVELRFYGGLTEDEVAAVLKVSRRTVTRGFQMAKSWLRARLDEGKKP